MSLSPITLGAQHTFLDALNRTVIIHGTNAVTKGPPWFPVYDQFETDISMSENDCAWMQKLGLNVLRLGVMWPGVEPTEGTYDEEYLDNIDNMVKLAASYGVYTLLDMHQDVLSRAFCGNGIPLWAADIASNESRPFPVPVKMPYEIIDGGTPGTEGVPDMEECRGRDFITYYFSGSVSKAFQSLYDNRGGLLDGFVGFWEEVVRRFEGENYGLGYEVRRTAFFLGTRNYVLITHPNPPNPLRRLSTNPGRGTYTLILDESSTPSPSCWSPFTRGSTRPSGRSTTRRSSSTSP